MSYIQFAFAALMSSSVALLIFSLVRKNALAAYVAAALATPICLYLAGYPAVFFVTLIFPLLLVYGGKKVTSNWKVSLLCYLPYAGISLMILLFGFVLDAW